MKFGFCFLNNPNMFSIGGSLYQFNRDFSAVLQYRHEGRWEVLLRRVPARLLKEDALSFILVSGEDVAFLYNTASGNIYRIEKDIQTIVYLATGPKLSQAVVCLQEGLLDTPERTATGRVHATGAKLYISGTVHRTLNLMNISSNHYVYDCDTNSVSLLRINSQFRNVFATHLCGHNLLLGLVCNHRGTFLSLKEIESAGRNASITRIHIGEIILDRVLLTTQFDRRFLVVFYQHAAKPYAFVYDAMLCTPRIIAPCPLNKFIPAGGKCLVYNSSCIVFEDSWFEVPEDFLRKLRASEGVVPHHLQHSLSELAASVMTSLTIDDEIALQMSGLNSSTTHLQKRLDDSIPEQHDVVYKNHGVSLAFSSTKLLIPEQDESTASENAHSDSRVHSSVFTDAPVSKEPSCMPKDTEVETDNPYVPALAPHIAGQDPQTLGPDLKRLDEKATIMGGEINGLDKLLQKGCKASSKLRASMLLFEQRLDSVQADVSALSGVLLQLEEKASSMNQLYEEKISRIEATTAETVSQLLTRVLKLEQRAVTKEHAASVVLD